METTRKHHANEGAKPSRPVVQGSLRGEFVYRPWSGRSTPGAPVTVGRGTSPLLAGEPGALPQTVAKVQCGSLEVDLAARHIAIEGRDLCLTGREYALLAYLAGHIDHVVDRSDLLAQIWTLQEDHGSNVLDVYVRRLRQKLGTHAGILETVRGFGYCLRSQLRT